MVEISRLDLKGRVTSLLLVMLSLLASAVAADVDSSQGGLEAWQAEYPSRPAMLLGENWDFSPVFSEQRPKPSDDIAYQNVKLFETPGRWRWQRSWYGYKIQWAKNKADSHWAWYRKSFELTDDLKNEPSIMLRCEGIFTQYVVWVNGVPVGETVDGYNPVEFDITDAVHRDRPNELTILVGDSNTLPDGAPKATQARFQRGIYDDILVYGRSDTYISDVFIKPSFREGSLTVEVDVAGLDEREASLTLEVRDDEEVVPLDFELESREGNLLRFKASWPDAQLWSPDHPYLYHLTAGLAEPQGVLLDAWRIPFGFREFWIEGSAFYLNGKKTFLRGIWGHFGSWMNASSNGKAISEVEAIEKLKSYNINSGRYHVQPLPDLWYEAADQAGFLVVAESVLNHGPSSGKAMEHVERFIKRVRNHPSVIMWSLTNEFEHWKNPREPSTTRYLIEMQDLAMTLDDTRPIQHSAYGRLDGAEQVVNVHYPLGGIDFPNLFYWPKDGSPPGNPLYEGLDWKRDKPLAIGEQMLLFNYDYFASVVGDALYSEPLVATSPVVGKAMGQLYAWNYQACLAEGLSMTASPLPGAAEYDRAYLVAMKEAYLPIGGAFDGWRGLSFFAGDSVQRPYQVWNTSEEALSGVFRFTVRDGAATLWTHEEALSLEPGETTDISIPFPAFESKGEKRKLQGAAQIVSGEGDSVFDADYPLAVFVRDPQVSHTGKVAILGASPSLEEQIRRLGVQAEALPPDSSAAALSGYPLVVLGDSLSTAWLESNQGILAEYVDAGGRVLSLFPTSGGYQWLPLEVGTLEGPATLSFRRADDSPVFENLDDADLQMWAPGNVIASSMLLMPESGNFEILAETGSRSGLNLTPLLALYYGKGSFILSTYEIVPLLSQEPAVALLLRNLIDWSLGLPEHAYAPAVVVGGEESTFQQCLKSMRLDASVVGSLTNTNDVPQAGLILARGDKLSERIPATVARELLASGSTLLVHHVTENDAAWLQKVVGQAPVFSLRGGETDVAPGILPDGLLANASLADLTWGDRPVKHPTPTSAELVTWQGPVNAQQSLVVAGMLQTIPVGDGKLVIDQILWDLEDRPPRMVSILLTALSAKLATIPKVFPETRFRPLDLGSYCNINVGRFSNNWIVYQDSGKLPENDQVQETEASAFNQGESITTVGDVPFVMLDPRKNNNQNAIIIRQPDNDVYSGFADGVDGTPEGAYDIEVPPSDRLVERIYFFHAYLENWRLKEKQNNIVGSYRINYMDGTSEILPLQIRYNIDKFKKKALSDLPAAKVVANYPAANNSVVSIYRTEWINPSPTKKIRSIDFLPGNNMRRVPILFGITLVTGDAQYI